MIKYFSMPADFKNETIDGYHKLNLQYDNAKVIETYGSITKGRMVGSGRLVEQMLETDFVDLYNYIKYSRQHNIDFNYTLNATHMHNMEFSEDGIFELKTFLLNLYEAGVRKLTIALPPLIEIIKSMNLDFEIKASCLCQITNVNKAMYYKRLGVNRIVPDESINRKFHVLERMSKSFGEGVEVIANQICAINCVYRMFHYNMVSENPYGNVSNTSVNYYEHRCIRQRYEDISNLLKLSWIRPEDLNLYTDIGINRFKIQGRHTFVKGGDPVKTVSYYFKEDYDGNLMDLLNMFSTLNNFNAYLDNKKLDGFIKPFYEKEEFCKNDCQECNYCGAYIKKAVDMEKATAMKELYDKFYNEYDQFNRQVNSVNVKQSDSNNDVDIDFDFM